MSKLIRKVKQSVFSNLESRLTEENQTLIGYDNPENQYDGIDTRLIMKCGHCGAFHVMTYRAFCSNQQGCSECQGTRPAVLYILRIHDTRNLEEAIKVGVSSSFAHRLKDIRNGYRRVEVLFKKQFPNKKAAMKDEAKILKEMDEFRVKLSFTTEAIKLSALGILTKQLRALG